MTIYVFHSRFSLQTKCLLLAKIGMLNVFYKKIQNVWHQAPLLCHNKGNEEKDPRNVKSFDLVH
jgi:hypothetical protein